MAKFWEVIKAFQEGTAQEAKTKHEANEIIVYKHPQEGVMFYDSQNMLLDFQNVDNADLTMEWEIIETLERQKFRVLQVVFESHMEGREPRLIPEVFENDSLIEAVGRVENDYSDESLTVFGAVGISEKGEITILVQEGERVDG